MRSALVYLGVLIVVVIIPIILNFTAFKFNWGANGDLPDWISFIGNYSGGIIGGIVAYVVARYQLLNQTKQQYIEKISKEIPVLTALSIEIEKISIQLQPLKKIKEDERNGKLNPALYNYKFDSLNWDRWNEINVILDPVLQEELLKFSESAKRNFEVLEFNLHDIDKRIEALLVQQNILDPISLEYCEMEMNLNECKSIRSIMTYDKYHYWAELPYLIEKVSILKSVLEYRNNKFKEELEKSIQIKKESISFPPSHYRTSRNANS